jgi:hypothetical protein
LRQAAWFGQPDNARRLIDAGAPLDVLDATHEGSPIGWAVHGSRYSGGAEKRPGCLCRAGPNAPGCRLQSSLPRRSGGRPPNP